MPESEGTDPRCVSERHSSFRSFSLAGHRGGVGPLHRWYGSPAISYLAPTGVCSGWGDPHYITFDGTYYTFLDNCTYVLVQQIVPVFGYFRVLIDNYFCDLGDSVSCPQSIIVEYHQDRVVLTRRPVNGVMTNQVDMSLCTEGLW